MLVDFRLIRIPTYHNTLLYFIELSQHLIVAVGEDKRLGLWNLRDAFEWNSPLHEIVYNWNYLILLIIHMYIYGGGKRCAQGSGGETWGKENIGETQT